MIQCLLHSNMVLFKFSSHPKYEISILFYIPIWFYSNRNQKQTIQMLPGFTFQYGSIQMGNPHHPTHDVGFLHSNMVLFKCKDGVIVKLEIPRFTFQYGSIQMAMIHIGMQDKEYIYIPIWFYSNTLSVEVEIELLEFTFQYGSIQMNKRPNHRLHRGKFTFQYGSIQIERYSVLRAEEYNLHSNMVLFKWNDSSHSF